MSVAGGGKHYRDVSLFRSCCVCGSVGGVTLVECVFVFHLCDSQNNATSLIQLRVASLPPSYIAEIQLSYFRRVPCSLYN
jgi:hypothetical protein